MPPVPPRVPVGLPSELVLRRPDVRQAAASLHAATAQVGVAIAAFYPSVSLTGNLNEIALQFSDLFTWQSHGFALGPSVTLPLFTGGRLRGQLRLDRAEQAEAAVSYEQAVLQAWHDVDNALTAYAAEQRSHAHLQTSVDAAQAAFALAQDQYVHGLVTFLNVLDAQRTLLAAQQQLVQSHGQRLERSGAALYGAGRRLGGHLPDGRRCPSGPYRHGGCDRFTKNRRRSMTLR